MSEEVRVTIRGLDWREADPGRLTLCPAGGAPQEGEGQPQQHGFWPVSPKAPGGKGQAT